MPLQFPDATLLITPLSFKKVQHEKVLKLNVCYPGTFIFCEYFLQKTNNLYEQCNNYRL